jgi:hypothetical protein
MIEWLVIEKGKVLNKKEVIFMLFIIRLIYWNFNNACILWLNKKN